MRYGKKRCGLQVERLEKRDVPGTVQAPNPGGPQAEHSGNIVGIFSAGVTGNGDLISSTEATAGLRNEIVWIYLSASGRGPL